VTPSFAKPIPAFIMHVSTFPSPADKIMNAPGGKQKSTCWPRISIVMAKEKTFRESWNRSISRAVRCNVGVDEGDLVEIREKW